MTSVWCSLLVFRIIKLWMISTKVSAKLCSWPPGGDIYCIIWVVVVVRDQFVFCGQRSLQPNCHYSAPVGVLETGRLCRWCLDQHCSEEEHDQVVSDCHSAALHSQFKVGARYITWFYSRLCCSLVSPPTGCLLITVWCSLCDGDSCWFEFRWRHIILRVRVLVGGVLLL